MRVADVRLQSSYHLEKKQFCRHRGVLFHQLISARNVYMTQRLQWFSYAFILVGRFLGSSGRRKALLDVALIVSVHGVRR